MIGQTPNISNYFICQSLSSKTNNSCNNNNPLKRNAVVWSGVITREHPREKPHREIMALSTVFQLICVAFISLNHFEGKPHCFHILVLSHFALFCFVGALTLRSWSYFIDDPTKRSWHKKDYFEIFSRNVTQ